MLRRRWRKQTKSRQHQPTDDVKLSQTVWICCLEVQQALEPLALTFEDALCLQGLAEGCETLTLLANRVKLAPERISTILWELELRFLVICQKDVRDRRFVYYYLTEAGRNLSIQAQRALVDKLQGFKLEAIQALSNLYQLTYQRSLFEPLLDISFVEPACLRNNVQKQANRQDLSSIANTFDYGRMYTRAELDAQLATVQVSPIPRLTLKEALLEAGLIALNGDGSGFWRI